MIKLSGKTHHLVFYGTPGARRIVVLSEEGQKRDYVGPYFRTSPIFPAAEHKARDLQFVGSWAVVFVGPIQPAAVQPFLSKESGYWLSLGILNNIVAFRGRNKARRLIRACIEKKIPYDALYIRNGRINHRAGEHFFPTPPPDFNTQQNLPRQDRLEFALSVADLSAVTTAIAARLVPLRPAIAPHLNAYLQQISFLASSSVTASSRRNRSNSGSSLESTPRIYFDALGELQKMNSGLSRFAAQTCVGLPPLLSHECHYWNHSALGVGSAVLGLLALVAHVHDALGMQRIPARFGTLMDSHLPSADRLRSLGEITLDINEFSPKATASFEVEDESLLNTPHLSFPFFSGRDGFQSNAYSVSVPISSIAAANNIRWALCNITHEISHDVIRAVLSMHLVPTRSEARREIIRQALADNSPSSWGNYIRRRFFETVPAFAVPAGRAERDSASGMLGSYYSEPDDILSAIEPALKRHLTDIEEIMVHAFDFLYFYRSQSEHYLTAIWSSWATIPGVKRRVQEYLLRSLCAISLHPTARKDEDYCFDTLERALVQLDEYDEIGDCFRFARQYLVDHREQLFELFMLQQQMAEFVRCFMFSEAFLTALHKETKNANHFLQNAFPDQVFSNPLAFASRMRAIKNISPSRSAWLYNCLAHCCSLS